MYFPRSESYFLVLLFSTWKGDEDDVVVTHTAQSWGLNSNRDNMSAMYKYQVTDFAADVFLTVSCRKVRS